MNESNLRGAGNVKIEISEILPERGESQTSKSSVVARTPLVNPRGARSLKNEPVQFLQTKR